MSTTTHPCDTLDMGAYLTHPAPLDRRLHEIANQLSAMMLAGELDRLPCDTRRLIETLPLVLLDCAGEAFAMRTRPWWQRVEG